MPPSATTRLGPRTTLADLVYKRLRDDIVHGRLESRKVISTGKLAKNLGTSAMPVRAALTRLETEGLVTVLPQKGVVVSRVSLVELEELFFIRSRLEGLAAFLACQRLTEKELVGLRQLLRTMKRLTDPPDAKGWLVANERWHHLIFSSCGNVQLRRLLEDLYRRGMGRRVGTPNVRGHMQRRYGEHLAILGSLERREPEKAERLWREHILRSGAEILRFLRKMQEQKRDSQGDES